MPSHCAIVQHSDQTSCETCGLVWDTNDSHPPPCGYLTIQTTQPAKQARIDSLMEAVTNTAIGWVIATVTWYFVGLLMGIPMTVAENQIVVGIFTVISIARQYILRRLFDGKSPWCAIKSRFKDPYGGHFG